MLSPWFYQEASVFPKNYNFASFLLIPLVYLLAKNKIYMLKPVAAVVLVLGILDLSNRWVKLSENKAIVNPRLLTDDYLESKYKIYLFFITSILLHILCYLPYKNINFKDPVNQAVLPSSILLLLILMLYKVNNSWPYTVSPIIFFIVGSCAAFISVY